MKGIVSILEELEKLIYKILLWLILIPKTLVQVFLHPAWAVGYIKQELGEGKSRFDEYLSPVVLLFIVALLPSVAWNFRPNYGIELTSPAIENPTPNRSLEFDAKIKFISTVNDGFITTYWRVEREEFDGQNYAYPALSLARYTNNPAETDSYDYYYFPPLDNNTIQDFYGDTFTVPGNYYVVLEANKFTAEGELVESYSGDVYVYVPGDSNENVFLSSSRQPNKEDDGKSVVGKVSERFKSEETYLLALGLLLPPLLFALATKLFGDQPLSEDVLRETFYIQCYYFSPIGFVFWASAYAFYFFTPDMFNHYDLDGTLITLLPGLLVVFWFMSVETHVIAEERKINGWKAFGIVVLCMIILLTGAYFVSNASAPQVQDGARKFAIWLYPLVAIGLLTAYQWLVARRHREGRQKASMGDVVLAVFTTLVIAITVVSVLMAGRFVQTNTQIETDQQNRIAQSAPTLTSIASLQQGNSLPQATVEPAQTAEAGGPASLESTPLSVAEGMNTPASAQPVNPDITPNAAQVAVVDTPGPDVTQYYTEQFDSTLTTWPYFLTRSDESAVSYYLDGGKLFIQLLQIDEKKPWFYLVNNAYVYGDVAVETMTTNSGVNANGVSLLCRYSNQGWYEFSVSNSGLYTIYAYDAGNRVYSTVATGGSPEIKTGLSSNSYKAICKGSELTLIVNDRLVTTVQETYLNLVGGMTGIAVSSPEGLPVSVDFEYVKVSKP